MSEFLSYPSCVKLQLLRNERPLLLSRTPLRNCYYRGTCKAVPLSIRKSSNYGVEIVKVLRPSNGMSLRMRCSCLGFVDGVASSEWVPVGDQLLLMASIFLTYLAGVIPAGKSGTNSQKNVLDQNVSGETWTASGRKDDEKSDINLQYVWTVVKGKLLDSLEVIENGTDSGNRFLKSQSSQARRPLSLYAVSEGPMMRLLWASFQQLEKEVLNISENPDTVVVDDWMTRFSQIIRESCQPISKGWLEQEFSRESSHPDKALISLMVEKLKGDDTIMQNIIKSGREYLYAELLYVLRFGSLRNGCSYDHNLFVSYAESILEDLVITLADGIASIYLELVSIDGNLSSEINSLGLAICDLSTRELQKLRNQVALNKWLNQNMEAVVSMYEDRFDLCTFQSQFIEDSSGDLQNVNCSWWKKFSLKKSETVTSTLRYIEIVQTPIPVKRTYELRALTGWRYYYSLFLELSDISMPFIRAVFDKVSDAISFFFVYLIGRSLGLIYTGIRQSLRWK